MNRSSRLELFCKKRVLKNTRVSFLIKLQAAHSGTGVFLWGLLLYERNTDFFLHRYFVTSLQGFFFQKFLVSKSVHIYHLIKEAHIMHMMRTTTAKQGMQQNSLMLSYTKNVTKLKIPAFDSHFSQSLKQQFLQNLNF